MKNKEPTPEPIGGFYDSEERKNRIAAWQGKLAIRRAFETMRQSVDDGKADRQETIDAMSNVMKLVNPQGNPS